MITKNGYKPFSIKLIKTNFSATIITVTFEEYKMNQEEIKMDNFSFYAPTYFAFGKDAERRAGELVKRFGGSKVLIHYGGGIHLHYES